MKNLYRNIHLYLGLAAGLVFFVECTSGTLLVFEEEIRHIATPEKYYNDSGGADRLSLAALVAQFQSQSPGMKVSAVKVYQDPGRIVELNYKEKKGNDKKSQKPEIGKKPKGGREAGNTAYINAFTGKTQAVSKGREKDFFTVVLELHMSLLAGPVGKTILGISTFVVLTILITGLVLWWPKTKKALKSRLNVKWDSGWKRLNHDFHIVLGFYCTFFILLFLLTSLPWSFQWANKALYTITNSKMENNRPDFKAETASQKNQSDIGLDSILHVAQNQFPQADYWAITVPQEAVEPISVTSPSTYPLHKNGFDNLYIDHQTGAIAGTALHKDTPGGWQLRRYMKPLHTGSIGGIATKLIAFVVCLISASFPVTGVILWLNRIKKGNKKGRKSKPMAVYR